MKPKPTETIRLQFDPTPVTSLLEEIADLLERGAIPVAIGERLLEQIDRADESDLFEVCSSDVVIDGQLLVRAFPTDRLFRFVEALRAGDCVLALAVWPERHSRNEGAT